MDCPDACSLVFERTADGRLKVGGNPDDPFTSGFTGSILKDHVRRIQSCHRVVHPQLKSKAGWKTISRENNDINVLVLLSGNVGRSAAAIFSCISTAI
jgi:hypothetical protein